MVTRSESAAGTRRDLIAAASELLDEGGPDAVTLREVGARAGVSRGAPYGHFEDKAHLLAVLATDSWTRLAETLETLRRNTRLSPTAKLERAVGVLAGVGRRRPHLYALMCRTPTSDPRSVALAGSRFLEAFVDIVADVVGNADARPKAALLLSSAHGIATMELSGQLAHKRWGVTSDGLIAMLVAAVATGGVP